MKNQVKIRTGLIVAAAYLYILATAAGIGGGAFVFVALYIIVAVVIGHMLLTSDLAAVAADAQTFRKQKPLRGLGAYLIDFQHVFYHDQELIPAIIDEINARLNKLGLLPALHKKEFTDTDKNLTASESREFYVASSEANRRGTEVALAMHFRKRAGAHSIQWWVLRRGFVDRNRKVGLLALAPVLLPFWLWARIKQELDLSSSVRTVYDAFYNSLDVVTDARSLHALVFDALVDILEKHGVDVSDLKLQRAQVMNINISGGRVRFGNIVQALRQAKVQTGGR